MGRVTRAHKLGEWMGTYIIGPLIVAVIAFGLIGAGAVIIDSVNGVITNR